MAESARAVLLERQRAEVMPFLGDWPGSGELRAVRPQSLPVLRWLPTAAEHAPAGRLSALARLVNQAAGDLAWRQTYRPDEIEPIFLERYGWCEIFGLAGPIPSHALACGLLLLGPDTLYPSHSHVAEELYIPLSGGADWQRGDGAFEPREPGELILHRSRVPHAMRTGVAPLLALYLWRGPGLGQSARLQS